MIQIRFKTENAAFDSDQREAEIERILHSVAEKIRDGRDSGAIHDANGNRIGDWIDDEDRGD